MWKRWGWARKTEIRKDSDGGRETKRDGARQRATEMGESGVGKDGGRGPPRLRGDRKEREDTQKSGSNCGRRWRGKESLSEERDRDRGERQGERQRKLGRWGCGNRGRL